MPTPLDHVLVVLITVVLPLHDLLFWYPRLLRAGPEGVARARRHAYTESIVVEWTLVGATAAWWAYSGRAWPQLGVAAPHGWWFWGGAALAAALIAFFTWQRISISRKGETDEVATEELLRQIDNIRPLLPHSRGEMFGFGAVSFTAGVCEEVLFRGFLIWYLLQLIPLIPALITAGLLFGMAHAYQGPRGVIQTAVVGLGMAVLYKVTGSLWIPMALHAFIDLNSGLLAYTFLQREGRRGWT